MPIKAITIDFWNTIFDSSNGVARNGERRGVLIQEIGEAGYRIEDARVETAYAGIWDYFDKQWLGNQRTPSSQEMIGEILRQLDVRLGGEAMERLVHKFEHGVLHHPPSLLDGAAPALEYLVSKAPLAIISDTAFSSGRQLRQLMESVGIAQYFTTFIFSDEIGVAKPHAEAFAKALVGLGCATAANAAHIGDIERTDIAGARAAGMKAILYRGDKVKSKYAEIETNADVVMDSWKEIGQIFEKMDG